MHLPVEITTEITDHFTDHLDKNPTDYICVYGSSVYSPDKLTSDVDLFAVVQKQGSLALDTTIEFIQDLHQRHGRELDTEVPYDNKVHYTAPEVEAAVQFGGFEVAGNRIVIPPVQKTIEFLSGAAIKARLLLNGLTSPHSVIGNDFSQYHSARSRAGEAITLLAVSLQAEQEFDVDRLLNTLTESPSGKSGEMYLGYKVEYPIVKEHLYGVLAGALDRLHSEKVIDKRSETYHVEWRTFDPVGYMKATAIK